MSSTSYRDDRPYFLGTLASLTQELRFHQERRIWVRPATLTPHITHLARFTNVTTLVFINLVTSSFHAASLSRCFGPFAAGVRRVRLHRPIARPTSLVQTILLFSAAIDVEIQHPRWSVADETEVLVPPPPGELRFTGTLQLRGFGEMWPQFFALLSAQSLRFQKIRLIGCEFSTSAPTQLLLGAVSHSTRTLHLVGFGNRESNCGSRKKSS